MRCLSGSTRSVAGGCDVDPVRYGQEQCIRTVGLVPARDVFEFALLERDRKRDMPTFCVCCGLQVLNVVRGGTLIQHFPDVLHHDDHRRNLGTFEGNEHDVQLEPRSHSRRRRPGGRAGDDQVQHHHQAIDRLGDGLVVTGRSVTDDLPEADRASPTPAYVLGVQWHPEADAASRDRRAPLVDAGPRQRSAPPARPRR